MEIIPLSEGAFTIDQTKVFVPFNKSSDDLQLRPKGSLLVEIQPFLVKTEKDLILIDTGLGYKDEDGELQIHNNLMKHGIAPEDITIVLLSHLHKDHSGGISFANKNGAEQLSFPNAKYYVNEKEFLMATDAPTSSYPAGAYDILKENARVTFTGDKGNIGEHISYELSGGHSPYHQAFWLKEGNETVFFGGDVAPQLQQMKSRFIAKYDFDGKRSMELRQQWWEQGAKENWCFLFYHDIKSPTNRPKKKEGLP